MFASVGIADNQGGVGEGCGGTLGEELDHEMFAFAFGYDRVQWLRFGVGLLLGEGGEWGRNRNKSSQPNHRDAKSTELMDENSEGRRV